MLENELSDAQMLAVIKSNRSFFKNDVSIEIEARSIEDQKSLLETMCRMGSTLEISVKIADRPSEKSSAHFYLNYCGASIFLGYSDLKPMRKPIKSISPMKEFMNESVREMLSPQDKLAISNKTLLKYFLKIKSEYILNVVMKNMTWNKQNSPLPATHDNLEKIISMIVD